MDFWKIWKNDETCGKIMLKIYPKKRCEAMENHLEENGNNVEKYGTSSEKSNTSPAIAPGWKEWSHPPLSTSPEVICREYREKIVLWQKWWVSV